ncbi:hypothetical protein XI09_21215 [Bradyrhizobium sp. CCBAU 11386]|nr:hypothetical protein [Bradyrhizobium sp. CCBAU 11386]
MQMEARATMIVRLHDIIKPLLEEGFRLSVNAGERGRVILMVTKVRSDGAEDQVAMLPLHNNVVGCNQEMDFWDEVGRYWRKKDGDGRWTTALSPSDS